MSEVENSIALLVGKVHSEIWIDGRLSGIGERAFGVLHGEARKELRLAGEFVVEARGELIGDSGDFGGCGVGARAVGAGGIVGQRITMSNCSMAGFRGTMRVSPGKAVVSTPGRSASCRNGNDYSGA